MLPDCVQLVDRRPRLEEKAGHRLLLLEADPGDRRGGEGRSAARDQAEDQVVGPASPASGGSLARRLAPRIGDRGAPPRRPGCAVGPGSCGPSPPPAPRGGCRRARPPPPRPSSPRPCPRPRRRRAGSARSSVRPPTWRRVPSRTSARRVRRPPHPQQSPRRGSGAPSGGAGEISHVQSRETRQRRVAQGGYRPGGRRWSRWPASRSTSSVFGKQKRIFVRPSSGCA